ncbi:MAG: 4-hydroxy-tetrahydrodipicolinate synthase [Bdellovibrionales bacterium]|nr:4-hydroxy-tetrahydrodipicolinate synthase [Bdellovibrionales bacterium]
MKKFEGVITALVTPFKSGRLDLESFNRLVKAQIAGGVSGFVVGGTTGESPTVTKEELEVMYQAVRKNAPSDLCVILGTGSNSTEETVQKTRLAEKLKADAALIVTPYYNKPPQAGMVAHYNHVARETQIPILIYNVPGRTGVSILPETIATLSKTSAIVGVKDATGDLKTLERMKSMVPKTFLLLSGDDGTSVDYCSLGGHGVISVVSHIIPKALSEFVQRARAHDSKAGEEFKIFLKLIDLIFIEANPIPVKAAVQEMGLIDSDEVRLPLIPMSTANRLLLVQEMNARQILKKGN